MYENAILAMLSVLMTYGIMLSSIVLRLPCLGWEFFAGQSEHRDFYLPDQIAGRGRWNLQANARQ